MAANKFLEQPEFVVTEYPEFHELIQRQEYLLNLMRNRTRNR